MKSSVIRYGFLCGLLLASCETVKAPVGTVPRRVGLQTESFGGWISVKPVDKKEVVEGEYIGNRNDTLYILTENAGLFGFGISSVESAELVYYALDNGRYTTWTVLGAIGSVSNGGFGLITIPLWIVVGSIATFNEKDRINYFYYPSDRLQILSQFARFPVVIPDKVNLRQLEPRERVGFTTTKGRYRVQNSGNRK